jgi:hypothetical protein
VLLAIDAYVHVNDAGLYDLGTGGAITQGSLFRGQASIAAVIAIARLVRPHWIVWTIALLVAASAATAMYLYTFVGVWPPRAVARHVRANLGATRQARVRRR